MRELSTGIVLAGLAAFASADALAATVSLAPPEAEWIDREAATNAPLPAAAWRGRGHFDVRISAAAGTNLVQVAFGRDADGNGELSYEETALVVGRGAEEAFFEDVAARRRYAEPLAPAPGRRGLGWRVYLGPDGAPTGLHATNETGAAVFAAWRHAPPAWSFDPSWDTVRVVSAGPDGADGSARVEIGPDGTVCVFK